MKKSLPALFNRSEKRISTAKIQLLITIGILLTLLVLGIGIVSAVNTAVANGSVPVQAPDITAVPPTQPPDLITTVTTQTQAIIAALTTPAPVTTLPPTTDGIESVMTLPVAPTITPRSGSPAVNSVDYSSLMKAGVANNQFTMRAGKRVSDAEKEAAAARYKKVRDAYLVQGTSARVSPGGFSIEASIPPTPVTFNNSRPVMDPGGIPHYFGPYPNWANSPMPMGNISYINVTSGGTGYTAPAITIADVYFTGSGATATATLGVVNGISGVITGITVTNGGTNYTAPEIVITDTTGSGAAATATLGGPYNSGLRKFVDSLPGLNAPNNLGVAIPTGVPDTTTYTTPASDYYEIAVVQFSQKMHTDLPETTMRGYVQLETPTITGDHYPLMYPNGTNITNSLGAPMFGVHKPEELGPVIVATKDKPVRVKFYNFLPIGAGGNLFIPVDTTVMGAGMGPQAMNTSPIFYTQNRAELHLHGGATPWISDGTPYQWITPANEYTSYPKGVSVYNVPDMPDPGDGAMTFFYTNQQSARLEFYHDHAHGITRLNVYAGEAAGYVVTDPIEQSLINGNITSYNPTGLRVLPDLGIPLVIQDRTWVDANTIAAQDPTWNWGINPGSPRTGDLWYPHVYMTAQNPADDSGVNAYGRWHYGPWFFPPTDVLHGPVANYWFGNINFTGEPPMMPGTPNPSGVGEAFMDTPTVNGVAYPNMTVEPRAYRFRVLNAADDRALNLQLYVADANVTTADHRNNTEVKMVPAISTPSFPANWPTDQRLGGVPDPATVGPSFIQIGTEGGFLPKPVVVPNQPITWVNDPTRFDFGNVDLHSLDLMGAERADVIVDFSGYAGKTLILYNDAPAAYPAGVEVYNYFTGDPDRTSTGGSPTTQPGYGPNIRTIMQIKVNNSAPAPAYDLAGLNSVWLHTPTKPGVFETAQPPIIVPQIAYNGVYNQTITTNNYARIADSYKNFTALSGVQFNLTFQPKALHDEMGAVYDQYGRMSGMLGLEVPTRTSTTAGFFPYPYSSPPTDVIMTSVGEAAGIQPGDGTQIWRLSHNGVDSHPIHWHMYNVQVLNRVGWDGFIRAPDTTELGWKDTLRVSPLEDTIIALRPVAVTVPFQVPDQVRAIEPITPLGEPLAIPPGGLWFSQGGNPLLLANGTEGIANHLVNYGWEYVWHCHILAHEEMDMMHAQAILTNAPGAAPNGLVSGQVKNVTTNITKVFLAWRDQSTNETDWYIQRTNISTTNWTDLKRVPSYSTHQTGGWAMGIDDTLVANETVNYTYRVIAANDVGDDFIYGEQADPGELLGFPYLSLNSTPSTANVSQAIAPPAQPTFGAVPTSGFVPLNVSFTTTAGTATGWNWDFGDGNYADDNGMQNPNHVYEIPGTYNVTLTSMNTGGFSPVSAPTTITVNAVPQPAVPTANFTNVTPTFGIAPFTVAFNADSSISDPAVWATWRWSFGDGTFSSIKNANHTYTSAGNFTVSLTATNLGGSNVMTRVGFVNVTSLGIGIGIVRGSHNWYLDRSGNGVWEGVPPDFLGALGQPGDVMVTGDWNGDGKTEIGVVRGSHTWYVDYDGNGVWSGTPADRIYTLGQPGDAFVTGDWNGNGTTEIGVVRGSHTWYVDYDGSGNWSGTPADRIYTLGTSGDAFVTGDWNGDRITEIGVVRGSHTWYVDYDGNGTWSGTPADRIYALGTSGDAFVTGDWNGDGFTEIGVFRNGVDWYLDINGNGIWDNFVTDRHQVPMSGISGDIPVTGNW